MSDIIHSLMLGRYGIFFGHSPVFTAVWLGCFVTIVLSLCVRILKGTLFHKGQPEEKRESAPQSEKQINPARNVTSAELANTFLCWHHANWDRMMKRIIVSGVAISMMIFFIG